MFFKEVLAKLITAANAPDAMETDGSAKKADVRHVLTELCCAFVRQLDVESIRVLLQTIEPQLKVHKQTH